MIRCSLNRLSFCTVNYLPLQRNCGMRMMTTTAPSAEGRRDEVLKGYRKLMKLRKTVFGGDNMAMQMSALEIRNAFKSSKNEGDPSKVDEMIQGIDEACDMLSHIVQAKRTKEGNYAVSIPKNVGSKSEQNKNGHDNKQKGVVFEPLPPQSISLRNKGDPVPVDASSSDCKSTKSAGNQGKIITQVITKRP